MPANLHAIVARLMTPPHIEWLGPYGARFVHALRLVALHDRAKQDPIPELAARLGSVEVAAKSLMLTQMIAASWPEAITVSRFCCRMLSHDEATIGAFVDAAAHGDRAGFEQALTGLIDDRAMHRLWEGGLALTAAELRAA